MTPMRLITMPRTEHTTVFTRHTVSSAFTVTAVSMLKPEIAWSVPDHLSWNLWEVAVDKSPDDVRNWLYHDAEVTVKSETSP